jgi:ATP-independent RNA helicase DbpA
LSTPAFSTLSLAPAWLDHLAQLGYVEMTPIQALALPAMLDGRDVLGQAATGTGKTAAFGLALLARITPRSGRPPPAMVTIAIQGGRHDRLRPGDIVGALTTGVGIAATDIGQITVNDRISFVAVAAAIGRRALDGLAAGRIKNKRFRAYQIRPPR